MQVPSSTQFQIAKAVLLYKETIVKCNLCNLVERTIIQQINAAVYYECLADLIDDETGLLAGTIPELLASLFETYSDIMSQTLAAKISTVESISYNHTKPIATIFHAINEYSTMAKASGAPSIPSQLINIGTITITNFSLFASDIRRWNEKTFPQKTWKSFKLHFSQAQKAIKKSHPHQSLSGISFHQSANATTIAVDIYSHITDQKIEEVARAEAITAERLSNQKMQEQMQQMVKSTQHTTMLLDQIKALTSTIKTLEYRFNNNR